MAVVVKLYCRGKRAEVLWRRGCDSTIVHLLSHAKDNKTVERATTNFNDKRVFGREIKLKGEEASVCRNRGFLNRLRMP
jgi:hypothetical protein